MTTKLSAMDPTSASYKDRVAAKLASLEPGSMHYAQFAAWDSNNRANWHRGFPGDWNDAAAAQYGPLQPAIVRGDLEQEEEPMSAEWTKTANDFAKIKNTVHNIDTTSMIALIASIDGRRCKSEWQRALVSKAKNLHAARSSSSAIVAPADVREFEHTLSMASSKATIELLVLTDARRVKFPHQRALVATARAVHSLADSDYYFRKIYNREAQELALE